MYRAVMKQVVSFLERAHKSLEILGTRINTQQSSVHRSKSEHQVALTIDTLKSTGGPSQYEDTFWYENFFNSLIIVALINILF